MTPPLSPNIFNAVLEEIFRQINWEEKGIKIRRPYFNRSKNSNNLRFAVDIIVIDKNKEELEIMEEDLMLESVKVGLTMNLSKIKILANIPAFGVMKIDNSLIEIVSEYKYLKQMVSFDNNIEKEIKTKRVNAWRAF